MRIKITDFGTAKLLSLPKPSPSPTEEQDDEINKNPLTPTEPVEEDDDRSNSFVGTAEYVSPELLTDKAAGKSSDLWAFGCILFQLLAGRPPFKASNEYQTFQKIIKLEYTFPSGFSPVARSLVQSLLVIDPTKRPKIELIKQHSFFDGVIFGSYLWTQKAPRLTPNTGITIVTA